MSDRYELVSERAEQPSTLRVDFKQFLPNEPASLADSSFLPHHLPPFGHVEADEGIGPFFVAASLQLLKAIFALVRFSGILRQAICIGSN